MSDIAAFIDQVPRAELHLHIEGTLEPELKFELAARNGVSLPYSSAADMRAGYTFRDLTSFLAAYYEGISVLRGEQDFYDLAMAYFRKAAAQHVVYAEVFFDPQAHTSRGIGFEEVIGGLHRGEGYRLTMHCDVDQADSVGHIWQCLDDIGVERIDHGVNCVEDDALMARLGRDGIGLTVCPVSNRCVSDGLKAAELKIVLDRSLRATVNSDDPAYFGAYVSENLTAAQQAVGLTRAELARLARNSFEIAWLGPADRDSYLRDLDAYVRQAGPS
jgi:adenine deaminase